MTGRTFKQRYAALDSTQVSQDGVSEKVRGWPLPNGARESDTPDGPCVVHDAVFSGVPIVAARDAFMRASRVDGERFSDPSDLLFLDTETTGLSGGTGTHVFLVGVGRFTGDALHVRQFFMRHPGDERALLSALEADLRHVATLVTYNGRAFDMPLLETRFRMHGRPMRQPERHVDLLSSSRAIWKHRLPNCALGTIERFVLGVTRDVDAPGWMIPQLYFDYLRSRRIGSLEPVFAHNRADIVSLARLAGLVHAFEAQVETPSHEIDRVALALHCLRRYGTEDAVAQLLGVWSSTRIPAELRLRAIRDLSVALKRRQRFEEAVDVWQRAMSDPSRAVRLYAYEELAKHLEHRVRDHEAARDLVRRGADGAELARNDDARLAFERRLERLERKLHRERARTLGAQESGG